MGCKDYFECEFCGNDIRRWGEGECCDEAKAKLQEEHNQYDLDRDQAKKAKEFLSKHGLIRKSYPNPNESISFVEIVEWMKSKGFE